MKSQITEGNRLKNELLSKTASSGRHVENNFCVDP